MATLNTTAFDWSLKVRYSKEVVQHMAYKKNPLLAMIRKKEDFKGKSFNFGVSYGAGMAARSAAFATAQTNKTGALGKEFALTRVKDYSVASIDSETIMASEGDDAALLAAITNEEDKKLYAIIRSMAHGIFRNGSGKIGEINQSSFATKVLTLNDAEDSVHFEEGMKCVFAADESSALRDSGKVLTVDEVDRDAGTVTFTANLNTVSGIADDDSVFCEGDYVSASDTNKIAGLDGWIPSTAPTSGDSWFGVDRSTDVTRLSGHRLSGTGKTIEEAIYDVAIRISREGGHPDTCILNHENWARLNALLGSRKEYDDVEIAKINFRSLLINGPDGPIKVYADQNCQADVGWVLTLDSWCLKSLGPAPRILDLDGQKWLREDSADAYQLRNAFMGNLYTNAPGHNGRTSL